MELVVGTVGAVGTAVVVVLAVAHTAEAAVDAAAASDSGLEKLEAVLKRFACERCPAKLEYVTTSREAPGSCARKRGDNSVPFGGGPCSARRSPDVPGIVGCFVDST